MNTIEKLKLIADLSDPTVKTLIDVLIEYIAEQDKDKKDEIGFKPRK